MSEPMDLIYKDPKYPSSKVVNGLSMAGPRAHLRGMGQRGVGQAVYRRHQYL